MKHYILALGLVALLGCEEKGTPATTQSTSASSEARKTAQPAATPNPEPAVVRDPNAPKNVLDVAVGSKDHSTLVAAVKAADYADSLTNPGPLTVFAPTNAAFDKLPKGTVEGLVKPEKAADLRHILQHHVAVPVYQLKDFKDGQVLQMVDGTKVTFHVKDGKVTIGEANIVATVPAANGVVHVIDAVLLPTAK